MKPSTTEPSSVRSACLSFQDTISGIPRQDAIIKDCEVSISLPDLEQEVQKDSSYLILDCTLKTNRGRVFRLINLA